MKRRDKACLDASPTIVVNYSVNFNQDATLTTPFIGRPGEVHEVGAVHDYFLLTCVLCISLVVIRGPLANPRLNGSGYPGNCSPGILRVQPDSDLTP